MTGKELKLYDRRTDCPKCGMTGPLTKYHNEDDTMQRECWKCGYVWYQRPLDDR